jgi:purine-binding chemotaxis protein CheW
MMGKTYQLLVFKLDSRLFALHLAVVDRIVRAVQVTPLPEGPETVLGVVNLKGQVVPTFNLRRRFQMPERDIDPGDQLIIAHTARRPVALIVDAVGEIIERGDQDVIASGEIFPGLDHVEGVAKIEDGIVMIHDLDRFLSLQEEAVLKAAMKHHD